MATWSRIRKKQETEYLAQSLLKALTKARSVPDPEISAGGEEP